MIRVLRSEDAPHLERMFEQQHAPEETLDGFEAGFLGDGLVSKFVCCDEEGRPRLAMVARLTAEVAVFGDPNWRTPKERFLLGAQLERILCEDLKQKGLDSLVAFIPRTYRRFAERIGQLGWRAQTWISMRKDLTDGQK